MNTFNSFCIAACMFMCLVGMGSVFVNALGVFSVNPISSPTGTPEDIFNNMTHNVSGAGNSGGGIHFDSIWLISTGGLSFVALLFAILTRTTNMIGVWLFGSIFWSGWISINYIFYSGGFLSFPAGIALVGMLWFGMIILFAGAVIGMLSGSIWMR